MEFPIMSFIVLSRGQQDFGNSPKRKFNFKLILSPLSRNRWSVSEKISTLVIKKSNVKKLGFNDLKECIVCLDESKGRRLSKEKLKIICSAIDEERKGESPIVRQGDILVRLGKKPFKCAFIAEEEEGSSMFIPDKNIAILRFENKEVSKDVFEVILTLQQSSYSNLSYGVESFKKVLSCYLSKLNERESSLRSKRELLISCLRKVFSIV
ncbi:hypothetical protein [Thermovibrio sp.]